MSCMELFEAFLMVFLSSTNVRQKICRRGCDGPDPALKINMETFYLFTLFIKFVYESYLLLNLR